MTGTEKSQEKYFYSIEKVFSGSIVYTWRKYCFLYKQGGIMQIDVGVAYYPEAWSREEILEDAGRMKECGVSLIRVAEFAWSRMEPSEGDYRFQWLVDAVNIFGELGIKTILCTPSSAAPAWMCRKYPEILRVNRDYTTKAWFGVRDHTCYTSGKYRELCVKIAKKMAEVFKDNPYIAGWQIDNEPGCSRFGDCHCPECQRKFREFLKKRYGTLEKLNQCWGTHFWSGDFYSWEEIDLEDRFENMASSRCLDSHRFRSDEQSEFILVQARAVKEICPDALIGTNNYCLRDRYKVFSGLDFAGSDLYPRNAKSLEGCRYDADLYRCLKPGVSPWMLETATAPGWPRNDLMELYYWFFIGHGYNHIFYFNWNNHPGGNEKDHPSIVSSTGQTGAKYRQLKKLIEQTKALPGTVLPRPEADCALIFEYDQGFIYHTGMGSRFAHVGEYNVKNHAVMAELGLTSDIISDNFDFSTYKFLVMPVHPFMTVSLADKLKKYVEEGGVLLVNGRCGMFDEWGKNLRGEGPEHLTDLLGAKVGENMVIWGSGETLVYDGKGPDSSQVVVSGTLDGQKAEGTLGIWTGTLIPAEDTEVLLTFANGELKGLPFLTCRKYGRGYALYYVTEEVDRALLEKILRHTATLAGLQIPALPKGLDCIRRGDYLFLNNFNDSPVECDLPWQGKNILGNTLREGKLKMEAFESAILEIKKEK